MYELPWESCSLVVVDLMSLGYEAPKLVVVKTMKSCDVMALLSMECSSHIVIVAFSKRVAV